MTDRLHLIQFVLIAVIFATGLAIVVTSPDQLIRQMAAYLLGAIYVVWGVLHHLEHKDLGKNIVFEYFLIGLLIFVILWTFIN